MTLDQFYASLSSVKTQFKWYNRDGYIRGVPAQPKEIDRYNRVFVSYCPICAVCRELKNEAFPSLWFRKAAAKLELDEAAGNAIMEAADEEGGKYAVVRRRLEEIIFDK
jgi:hypothetical protein